MFALVCHDAFDGGYDVSGYRRVIISAVNSVGQIANAEVFHMKLL